ncbi:hypothetical protein F4777DRAFT_457149 [Nemania sp. FL0916]|nr:hypothetical protein F4777DRAFT_457149 [Nemania sp. FL0916]
MTPSSNPQPLSLTATQADTVQKAVRYWSRSNLISSTLAKDLLGTIQVVEEKHDFDWDKFAKYTFRLAIICFAIAVLTLIFDDVVPKLIKRIIALPASIRITITSALGIAIHIVGYQHSLTTPQQPYLTEAIHSLGALFFGLSALQLFKVYEGKNADVAGHRVGLALALVYGATAVLVKSTFIWTCAVIVFGVWFGCWTAYRGGTYYLGMNYPLRFVFLSIALIAVSMPMRAEPRVAVLWSATRVWGLIYMFHALWILSLYGNDKLRGDEFGGYGGPRRLAFWSLAFLAAAAVAVWHGLRYGDATTKGFGLAFLGINIYTKFFEFCWSAWYKSVFFAVMALSLALMGRYAESVNAVLQGQGKY